MPATESTEVQALARHIHKWDVCRNHGQYKYRICLNGCNERRPC